MPDFTRATEVPELHEEGQAPMNLERFAYYWVYLNEPDGASWCVAQFIETKYEKWDYWNRRPSEAPIPQNYWSMCGRAGLQRQVATEGASNRWTIGEKISRPEAGVQA